MVPSLAVDQCHQGFARARRLGGRFGIGLVRFDAQKPAGGETGETDMGGTFMRQGQPPVGILQRVFVARIPVFSHAGRLSTRLASDRRGC